MEYWARQVRGKSRSGSARRKSIAQHDIGLKDGCDRRWSIDGLALLEGGASLEPRGTWEVLIGGLIYGAVILNVSAQWIAVGAIVLLGLAILKGVQATRAKDPS